MDYNKVLVSLMEKTIREVHSLFTMDKQDAAREFKKDAKDIDRFLLDRADAILSGVQFFIDAQKPETTSAKPETISEKPETTIENK